MFPFPEDNTPPSRNLIGQALFAYRMRWKRRRLLYRSIRKRKQLSRLSFKMPQVPTDAVLVFSTMRNEMERLPFWLSYYRGLGVRHFLIVDNDSDDGTAEYLSQQPDVSVWTTTRSYKLSRFGVDWLTCLQIKFGHGKWCLTVDADEILTYPDADTKSLPSLTAELAVAGQYSLGAVMLDMYPKGPVTDARVAPEQNPIDVLNWFDVENYRAKRHPVFGNLWIQGGVRDRMFFGSKPERAPTLNKIPLVKWNRRFVYVTSTHQILPRRLADVFSTQDYRRTSGVLLHTKFMPNIAPKSKEELERRQHFENSDLYQPYYAALIEGPDLWTPSSVAYKGPEQLEKLGFMTRR